MQYYHYYESGGYKVTANVNLDDNRGSCVRTFSVRYAFCSPKDTFQKPMAHTITSDDFGTPEVFHVVYLQGRDIEYPRFMINKTVRDIAVHADNCPQRVRHNRARE